MKLPRDVNSDKLISVLAQFGYSVSRQVGSHIRLTSQDGKHQITIPNHDPLKLGTLHKILKDVCLHTNTQISDIVGKL